MLHYLAKQKLINIARYTRRTEVDSVEMSNYNDESATDEEEQEIITDEELLRRYGVVHDDVKLKDRALNKLKTVSSCSGWLKHNYY